MNHDSISIFRVVFGFACLVVVQLTLSGCGDGHDGSARDQQVVLAAPFGEEFSNAMRHVGDQFEAQHAGVTVRIVNRPAAGYDTWIETQLVSGRAPDIFFSHDANRNRKRGLVIGLDAYLDEPDAVTGRPWREQIVPGILERYADERNRVNMVPGDVRGYGFYCNEQLFERAGVAPPTTWAQLVEVCRKLKQSGVIPFACGGGSEPRDFAWFIWGLRGLQDMLLRHLEDEVLLYKREPDWTMDLTDPWNDTHLEFAMEDLVVAYARGTFSPLQNPDWAVACRLLKELVPYYPPGFAGMTANDAKDLFITGRAAIIYYDTAFAYELRAATEEPGSTATTLKVGMFTWPALTRDTIDRPQLSPPRGQIEGGKKWNVAQSNDTRQRRAIDFLRFMLRPENVEYVQSQQTAPSLPSVIDAKGEPGVERFRSQWLEHGISKITWVCASFDPQAEDQFIRQMQLYLIDQITLGELMRRSDALIVPTFLRTAQTVGLDVAWIREELKKAGDVAPAWLDELEGAK